MLKDFLATAMIVTGEVIAGFNDIYLTFYLSGCAFVFVMISIQAYFPMLKRSVLLREKEISISYREIVNFLSLEMKRGEMINS